MFELAIGAINRNRGKLLGAVVATLIVGWISMPALAKNLWQSPIVPDALGAVSGTVLDNTSQPLANISVELTRRELYFSNESFTALTDNSGHYRVNGLLTGIYSVRFSDPTGRYAEQYYGDAQSSDGAFEVPVIGNEVEGIDVTMHPATGISGSISTRTEFRWGQYDISVYQPDQNTASGFSDHPFATTYNDWQDSIYSFTSLPPGRYRVCANFSGNAVDTYYSYRFYSECYDDVVTGIESANDVMVTENNVTSEIDFIFGESKQYGTISGVVTGPEGNPISGVRVIGYPFPIMPFSAGGYAEQITDIEGRYTLTSVLPVSTTVLFNPSGQPYELSNENPLASEYYGDAYTPQDATYILIESGSTVNEINAQLNRKGGVSGRISIQGEQPSSQPTIILWRRILNQYYPDEAPYYSYENQYVDAYDPARGEYTLENIQPGTYLIEAVIGDRLSGYHGGASQELAKAFTVRPDQINREVDISIAEGLYEGLIEGRVTVDGIPTAGIQAQLVGSYLYGYYPPVPIYEPESGFSEVISYALTDENGHYAIGGLTTGSHAIRFVSPDPSYAPVIYRNPTDGTESISMVDGQTISNVGANLERAGSISGMITRSDGVPASYYEFIVEAVTAAGFQPIRNFLYTDDQGNYFVDSLPPGTYQLRFFGPYSYSTHLRLTVEVKAGEALVNQNGVAGPGVPTSLTTMEEPSVDKPFQTDLLFVPFVTQ